MAEGLPQKVYRYRNFGELTMNALCFDELYFAAPSTFNDPMDCQPTVVADSNKKELKAILNELIVRRVKADTLASLKSAKLAGENAHRHSEKLAKTVAANELAEIAYNATNPEFQEGNISVEEAEVWLLTSSIQTELLQQYDKGVCCFSSKPNSSLLWSHYGDQHRGLCVGYSLDRDPKPVLHKVIYDNNRNVPTSLIAEALLRNDSSAKSELDNSVLLRKASPWKYESEWRLFGSIGLNESPLEMVDITFGLRCPWPIIHTVVNALESNERELRFYVMSQVRGSYKLRRNQLDVYELRNSFPIIARSGIEIFGSTDNAPEVDD